MIRKPRKRVVFVELGEPYTHEFLGSEVRDCVLVLECGHRQRRGWFFGGEGPRNTSAACWQCPGAKRVM